MKEIHARDRRGRWWGLKVLGESAVSINVELPETDNSKPNGAVGREWETRNVRAWNLKPGDVIDCLNRKTMRAVKQTVKGLSEHPTDRGSLVVEFRRVKHWGWVVARNELIRVRRLTQPKAATGRSRGSKAPKG